MATSATLAKDFDLEENDKHVPINSTVKQSTLDRLDIFVAAMVERNPKANRSKIVNALLVEKLDELGIEMS